LAAFGFTKPLNRIVVQPGEARLIIPYKTGVGTVRPGFFVKRGADDNTVILTAASADRTLGVVGMAGADGGNVYYMPATLTATYNSGDEVPVLSGGGFSAMVWHDTSSETVTLGDNVMLSALVPGAVCKATLLTIPAGGTAVTSGSATPTIMGADPSFQVVGQALETLSFAGTAGWLTIKLTI